MNTLFTLSGPDDFYVPYSIAEDDLFRSMRRVRRFPPSATSGLLTLVARMTSKIEAVDLSVTDTTGSGDESLPVAGSSRDGALERLADLEAFAKGMPENAKRELALRTCRNAIALVSFWPAGIASPDADIDDDGIVSLEQFSSDGTLSAVFDFLAGNVTTYAILTGTTVVDKGYLNVLDAGQITKVFRTISSATETGTVPAQ